VACEKLRTFLRFFQNPKKHDFLRFFEWLTTFSRTLTTTESLYDTSTRSPAVAEIADRTALEILIR